jgi:hypothetical protein
MPLSFHFCSYPDGDCLKNVRLSYLFPGKSLYFTLVQQMSIIPVILHSVKFVLCSSRTHSPPLKEKEDLLSGMSVARNGSTRADGPI